MKSWKKVSLLTLLGLGVFIYLLFWIFNLKLVKASSADVDFSPDLREPIVNADSINPQPKNIILFIADGLGFTHLSLAMQTGMKVDSTSVWKQFDVRGWHDTRATYGPLTDSGASATAIATGTSTFFDVIGQTQEGERLTNVFELATENGYNTAIVTDSYVWDATPAAFVAHTASRDSSRIILEQLAASELDLLFGELEDVGEEGNPEEDETLEILKRRFRLIDHNLNLPVKDSALIPIASIYQEDEIQDLTSTPNLPTLTDAALDYLDNRDQPFILLVESEEMDAASHSNNSKRIVKGLQSIEETISRVLKFAEQDGETLLLFTSDHETGGLAVVSETNYPKLQLVWATRNHSAAVVPLLAKGPGADQFVDIERNWQIGALLKKLIRTR